MADKKGETTLGLNGLGRIGKMTLWTQLSRKHFERIVVNTGRQVGGSLADVAHYIERDSTYGALHKFLYGHKAASVVNEVNEAQRYIVIDGVRVEFLMDERNPKDIPWREAGVRLVVDATGQFLDPNAPADAPKGSCLGHLEAGAEKVVVSAPFKLKDGQDIPDYAKVTVMGLNDDQYDPARHKVISHASCTTTCLGHMMQPLFQEFGVGRILSASMTTVHATTGSQPVLDSLPKAGAKDLRKNRSAMNNIILTTTGAAKALAWVLPEVKRIGFAAESVRVPVATGSLIILAVSLQDECCPGQIDREFINGIYRNAAQADPRGYLIYTEEQGVSSDIVGAPKAGAVIEAAETDCITGNATLNLRQAFGRQAELMEHLYDEKIRVPITQAVIYGWYDNEFGGYVNLLGDRTVSIAQAM